MKITCPHCSQRIEIDLETLTSLQGVAHFECPACSRAVPVPLAQRSQPVAPLREPDPPVSSLLKPPGDSAGSTLVVAHHGMNRNLLILGSAALLVLGGLGFFLASQKSGNSLNTTQNTRNEIINNSYFQNLIASGATSREDLEAMVVIRPYEDGFIGISKGSLAWEPAAVLARKAGGGVLEPSRGGAAARGKMMPWLAENLAEHLIAPAWVREGGQAGILDGAELLAVTGTDRPRKVLVSWNFGDGPAGNEGESMPKSAEDPWRGFDPGPLVFEDTLAHPDALKRTNFVEGQYTPSLKILDGVGLRMPPGHTFSMVWPKAVLGDACRVEFEAEPTKVSSISWVMKGSGTGNSSSTGIGFLIRSEVLTIRREGTVWLIQKLPIPLEEGKSVIVQTDLWGARLVVRINGTAVLTTVAMQGLDGPLHGWFGMSGSNCIYRNLRIWSSEKEQSRQPELSPPVTVQPRQNGEEIFNFNEPNGPLGESWRIYHPERVHVEGGALLLSAYDTNGWPQVVPNVRFPENFAVEFVHCFTSPETLNFSFVIAKAPAFSSGLNELDEIFEVSLPRGDGRHQIRWESRKNLALKNKYLARWGCGSGSPLLASNAFYAPVKDHDYRIRLEWLSGSIRVFLNGGLLLEAKRPSDAPASTSPTYIGLSQFYSSSIIKSLRVFHLPGNE